ncbi:hypothetical protein HPB48_020222 [Haemaphysalis longicornis]|uniref:Tick transposon n=1 Tax=Haemaphysalis longicornis TaxID=44386 RepID=A0A9J6FD64_HAELO|nr:hypothetical protein HPB48_020222 [Haemaphysalis longicornis]
MAITLWGGGRYGWSFFPLIDVETGSLRQIGQTNRPPSSRHLCYRPRLPLQLTPESASTSASLLYAEETIIFNADKCLRSLTGKLNNDLASLAAWCSHNKLQINPTKTRFVVCDCHQRVLNYIPRVVLNKFAIEAEEEAVFLGLQLDRDLKFHSHVSCLRRKIAYGMRVLIKSRDVFSQPTILSLYYAFVLSHINYFISSWGNTYTTHLASLQTMQNQCISILTRSPYRSDAKTVLIENNILNIESSFKYKLGILLFKEINNQLPVFIIPECNLINTNITRFARNHNFILPLVHSNYGIQTALFAGIRLWNTITAEIKISQSIGKFKKELKTFLASMPQSS